MKKKMIITPIFLFLVLNCNVFGVGQPSRAVSSNYVVIGAFSVPRNAVEFVENARKNELSAEYAINTNRHLFYVYVLSTDDRAVAVERAKKLRSDSPYFDTWVYSGYLGEGPIVSGKDINPETGEKITVIQANDGVVSASANQAPESNQKEPVSTEVKVEEKQQVAVASVDEAEVGKSFLFKLFTSSNQEEIKGDVDVIDLDRTRKVATYRGNEDVRVRPVNKSGNISLSCEVFGYRKVQKNINYNDPSSVEGVQVENGKTIVPFELVRLQKGDIAVMYNVYFFKDAAIMRPESRYEVSSLLDMLRENPKYKIRIHGHTNGNATGKIVSATEESDLFSLANTKDGYGSAKKLSEERAKVIQQYLLREGIEHGRMTVKAWGGKRPLFDKNSAQAQGNVRVEIEILEN